MIIESWNQWIMWYANIFYDLSQFQLDVQSVQYFFTVEIIDAESL